MRQNATDLNDPSTRQRYLLKMVKGLDFQPLIEVWRSAPGGFSGNIETGILAAIYETCADKAIRHGEVFLAEETARLSLEKGDAVGFNKTRAYQLQALALARGGATKRASDLLMRLAKVAKDSESQGLLARTFRDLAWAQDDPDDRRRYFKEAYQHAQQAFAQNPKSYYNAIQAAQFAFLADLDPLPIRHLLRTVRQLCLAEEEEEASGSEPMAAFWRDVTLAEAALIEGDLETTLERYRAMLNQEEAYPADTDACRSVAFKLIEHHGDSAKYADLLDQLRPRPVVVFSGHQFDCGRNVPRLPLASEAGLKQAFRDALEDEKPRAAYCSMSLGADLLFAETVLKRNSDPGRSGSRATPLTVILAHDRARTLEDGMGRARLIAAETGMTDPEGFAADWGRRIDRVLTTLEPSAIHEIGFPTPSEDSLGYAYTNSLMSGMALLHARPLGSPVCPWIVFDGTPSEVGGTGDFLANLPESRRLPARNFYSSRP